MFIEFYNVKNACSAMVTFLHCFCQIHSGNYLQKIDELDLILIKLWQNQQGFNFLCPIVYKSVDIRSSHYQGRD